MNGASGEATWVRPELGPDGRGSTAPARETWEAVARAAYDYDALTRTWNPREGVSLGASSGSLLATLRPRVAPLSLAGRSLPAAVIREATLGTDEVHALATANQEKLRLHMFAEHLKKQAKSAVVNTRSVPGGKVFHAALFYIKAFETLA